MFVTEGRHVDRAGAEHLVINDGEGTGAGILQNVELFRDAIFHVFGFDIVGDPDIVKNGVTLLAGRKGKDGPGGLGIKTRASGDILMMMVMIGHVIVAAALCVLEGGHFDAGCPINLDGFLPVEAVG